MSDNIPTNEKLWGEILDLARGKRKSPVCKGKVCVSPVNDGKGFTTYPSAYANGWALAQYKRLGGKWRKKASVRVAQRYLSSVKRDDPKKKNTGKGGLDTWFSGHGGGKPKERATWGDWIAITPVKHTVKKENGEDKTYEAGDIVGPCAVSSQPEWSSVTDGGKRPLKCMPREKAHKMPKEERASLARVKRREEKKHRGQKPVMTPTFSKKSDFYREISPPDSLSSMQSGTPVSKDNTGENEGEGSALPNGDTARNIGRPSPDSPNLKYRNLDKSESVGRTPANKEDLGYVHDSGSGSARVIPWDSGYANNSSPLRRAALIDNILNKMSDAVIDRSSSVRIVADNYLERLKEEPITVSVGDHEVTLEVKEGGDIYLSCTCPFWRYQGPEYHASKEGYLYGSLRGTGDEPKKKDPNGINKLCKHSYALLNSIFGD